MAREKSSVKELYIMDGGLIGLDKSLMTGGVDQGKWIKIPIPIFLVVTDVGNILIDTGMNPEVIEDPAEAWGKELAAAVPPEMTEENDVRNCLKKLGLKPDDIKYVVNSHFHHDHVGGNKFFPKAEHIVQKAEFRFAQYPDKWYADRYIRKDFDHPLNWRLIEGDTELVPGVRLMLTNGHTAGHQSTVLYDVPNVGTVVLSHDAIYMRQNIEEDLAPGICWNGDLAVVSMHRLINLAKIENAQIIVSHDLEYFRTLPLAPKCYDR